MNPTVDNVRTHTRFQRLEDNFPAWKESVVALGIGTALVLLSVLIGSKRVSIALIMAATIAFGWSFKCMHIMVVDFLMSKKNADRKPVNK